MSRCRIDECDRPIKGLGLCNSHYTRLRRRGTTDPAPRMSLTERFWSKVDKRSATECWEWRGPLNNQGYGEFIISWGRAGESDQRALAHRYAYQLATGEEIAGKVLMHSCDNPPCVNPGHLTPGTHSANALDSVAKGRANRSHGEAHRDAKLTAGEVLEIRARDLSRYGAFAEVAREFGVSTSTIRKIVTRHAWRHVA